MTGFKKFYSECMDRLEVAYEEVIEGFSALNPMIDDNNIINNKYTEQEYRKAYVNALNRFTIYVDMVCNYKGLHLLIEQKYDCRPLQELLNHYQQVYLNTLRQQDI